MAAAQETVKKAQKTTKVNVEKVVKDAKVNLDNVAEFNKSNYEALVASGEAAVKVAQTANADFMENAKKAVEKNVADVKSLFSAKTPAEFFELQASIFKTRYDEFVVEATRGNEAATHTANEVFEPLKTRFEEVATKYNFPIAG